MTFSACVKSMRLRTLPLSLSGIAAGIFIASYQQAVRPVVAALLVLTAVSLQILSNLSNELGDTLAGTDTADRQGIHYSLQDGEMTVADMKRLIAVLVAVCCLSGALMIYSRFGTFIALEPALFLALGAAAIWAAMRYTLGRNPYGYRGYGDIFVFIFFGLATTIGGYLICAPQPNLLTVLLPGISFGLFSVAVLNVNNIRDMKTDAATRVTMAIRMGGRCARIYQTVLIVSGWIFLIVNTVIGLEGWTDFLYVVTIPLFVIHLRGVWTKHDRELDPMLPLLVMGTFATALLMGLLLVF